MINNKNIEPSCLYAFGQQFHITAYSVLSGWLSNFIIMNKPELLKKKTEKDKWGNWLSLFQCPYCKNVFKAMLFKVNHGSYKSCGCVRYKLMAESNTTHGMRHTNLYIRWALMKARVKKNNIARKYYFDKGITICKEWQKFEDFRDWALANGFKENLTIDRIDNSKGYSPENCRWVTQQENSQNRDNALELRQVKDIKIRLANKEKPICIARDYNVTCQTIRNIKRNKTWQNIII